MKSGNSSSFKMIGSSSPLKDTRQEADGFIQKNAKSIKNSIKEYQGAAFKQNGVGDKVKDVVSKAATTRDVVSKVSEKVSEKVPKITKKITNVVNHPVTKNVGKVAGNVGKRFLGPAGVALTAHDAYKFMDKYKHMPKQNLTRDAKVQKKYGGTHIMGAGK